MTTDLMTPIQIAEFLGITTTTTNHLMQAGRIPSVAVGSGRQRIHRVARREDVVNYKATMDARKQQLAEKAAAKEARRRAREAKRANAPASAKPVEPALPFANHDQPGHGVRKAIKHNTEVLAVICQRLDNIEHKLADLATAQTQTRNLIATIARELGVKELQ
jgi:excisionase family DNA binding protein